MRRLISLGWLAAAISIAAAGLPARVHADPSSCLPGPAPAGDPSTAGGVTVHRTADHSVLWCSAAVIEAHSDVPDETDYQIRATPGAGAVSQPVSNALSVSALLSLAGIDPATVDHAEIPRTPGVGAAALSGGELGDPAAHFPGALKPIVWINGAETQYLRPLRGPSDTNAADQIVAADGAPLSLSVYSGPLLRVIVTATPARVTTKQAVTLAARVIGTTPADGRLSYTWDLQDGTATGATVSHRYAVAGTWHPTVTVQGSGNDSGGVSEPVTVTVGTPPGGGHSGTPGGSDPRRRAPASGGLQSNRAQRSESQASRRHARDRSSSGQRTTPTSTTPTQTTPTPTAQAPTTPAPSPPTTTPAAGPPASSAGTRQRPARARRPLRRPRRHSPTPPAQTATVVRGRLISDVISLTPAQLAAQSPPAATAAPAPSARLGGGSVTPVAGIAAGSVIMLLLGAGAGLELRGQRHSVTPPRAV